MHRNFLRIAALFGALSVILGAFGAHKLKELLGPENVTSFQTGVTYQFYHTLALLVLGVLYKRYPNKFVEWAGFLFIGGIILFSGSLYLLTAMQATKSAGISGFGLLTPIGGLLLVAGWILLLLGIPAARKAEKE